MSQIETFSTGTGNFDITEFGSELISTSHKRTRINWLAGLMASLMLLTPLGSNAVSAVLCISEDGHIHAEKAIGLNCDRSVSELDPDSHTAHSEGKSCTDLPLPFGNATDNASFQMAKAPLPHVSQEVTAFFPSVYSNSAFKTNEYSQVVDNRPIPIVLKPPLVLRI